MDLIGRKIAIVRAMTRAELQTQGWESCRDEVPVAIVLDDGTRLYASRDSEGNGPGVFFGEDRSGAFAFGLIVNEPLPLPPQKPEKPEKPARATRAAKVSKSTP